ncbi:MAG: DUF2786 domain-containing protein [Bdellovibrionales bacterium]
MSQVGAFTEAQRISLERAALLELNQEHEAICRYHKLKLRSVAITLFDSDSMWGQYDSRSRTISISRKLIFEHPWNFVIGIFRHEMAHQLVDEETTSELNAKSQRPHDEKFKSACKRLGVPGPFSRAGINLKKYNLNWKLDLRNEAAEKIIDKTKKLLALANSTNEHEAHLAMERVRELYAKHNLRFSDTVTSENFVHLVISMNKKRLMSWEQRTISLLTEHFFVKVLLFQQYEMKSQTRFQAIELIGRAENVLMAEYVFHFLLNQVELALNRNKSSGQNRIHRKERASFRLGVLDGFDNKLKMSSKTNSKKSSMADSMITELTYESSEAAQSSVIGAALEKFHQDPHLDNYLSEIYPRLGRRRSSTFRYYDKAFSAGHAAGKTINLQKPITTDMGNLGRFIAGRSDVSLARRK